MRIKSVAFVLYERFSMILKTYISRTDKNDAIYPRTNC